jgi:hypothetical protein
METINPISLQNYSLQVFARQGRVQARGQALFTAQANGTDRQQTNHGLLLTELVEPRLTRGRWGMAWGQWTDDTSAV